MGLVNAAWGNATERRAIRGVARRAFMGVDDVLVVVGRAKARVAERDNIAYRLWSA
jgi:hypothetical protein